MDDKPRPVGQLWFEDDPELPFEPEWGQSVRRARVAAKLNQADLARIINVNQAMVSYIENGEVSTSKAVLPIVRALGVPMPRQYFTDEEERRWAEAGRVLRRVNEAGFRGLLAAAEQMIAASAPKEH